jgi:hypothetical protein
MTTCLVGKPSTEGAAARLVGAGGGGSCLSGVESSGLECLIAIRKHLPAEQLTHAKRHQSSTRCLVAEFTGFSPSHLPAGEDHDVITRLQELLDHDVHDGVGLGLLCDPLPRRLRAAVDSSGRLELHIRGDKGKHGRDVALVPGIG